MCTLTKKINIVVICARMQGGSISVVIQKYSKHYVLLYEIVRGWHSRH